MPSKKGTNKPTVQNQYIKRQKKEMEEEDKKEETTKA